MKLPKSSWRKRHGLPHLLTVLGGDEGETRFVGGCVRDTLIGIEASDIDLATRLPPDEVVRRLEGAGIKAVPTGIAHGTITAVLAGRPIEVTTLRRDVSTDGRRATIAYTKDWREDAARRDFTINALSADPRSGELFDYFGGLEDLEARRIRFIGEPLVRIAEDHLRILRFFRFHARFGAGAPDEAGLAACAERANDLMALSRERISDELLKLLALPDPTPTVELMLERGILRPVLPEIETADRLERLIEAEREAKIEPDPIRRLAALLPADPAIAGAVGARLRLSKRSTARLLSAAETGTDEPYYLAYRIGIEEAVDRFLLHSDRASGLAELQAWKKPLLPIRGGDLIAMGLKAGPVVAKVLRSVEEEWARSGFSQDRRKILESARLQVEDALRSSQ
jgi:poly(A) polymerase